MLPLKAISSHRKPTAKATVYSEAQYDGIRSIPLVIDMSIVIGGDISVYV